MNATPYRTHTVSEVGPELIGASVRLSGWAHTIRRQRHIAFVLLREASGTIQVVLPPAAVEGLTPESAIQVEGVVAARAPHRNPAVASPPVELRAESVSILNRASPLPFSAHETPSEEERLRHRPLSMRWNPGPLHQRAAMVEALRASTRSEGFIEVETPVLVRRTPGGAAPFEVPVGNGMGYALAQSPQIWKQLLVCGGVERYCQLAHCFRNEGARPERQPEFSQFEIEVAFTTAAEVQGIMERAVRAGASALGVALPEVFPRLTHAEAMARFGTDKPHLGNPLELVAVPGASSCIVLPLPQPPTPAEHRAWMTLAAVNRPARARLREATSAERAAWGLDAPSVWVAEGPEAWGQGALGRVRIAAGEAWGLVTPGHFPLWVESFPLFERSEQGVWESAHHPFTRPQAGHERTWSAQPENARAEAFDLVLNGMEVGGGSMRIHEAPLQEEVLAFLGLGAEEAEAHFGPLLRALRWGAPPHGGMALGVERLMATLIRAPSIREVMAFPKSTGGQCLLTEALSPASSAAEPSPVFRKGRRDP